MIGDAGTTGPIQERLLAFCPARAEPNGDACQSATLVQEPGKVLPPLRFGELVVLDNVNARKEGGDILFTPTAPAAFGQPFRKPRLLVPTSIPGV